MEWLIIGGAGLLIIIIGIAIMERKSSYRDVYKAIQQVQDIKMREALYVIAKTFENGGDRPREAMCCVLKVMRSGRNRQS